MPQSLELGHGERAWKPPQNQGPSDLDLFLSLTLREFPFLTSLIKALCLLQQHIYYSWNDTEKISVAPEQG